MIENLAPSPTPEGMAAITVVCTARADVIHILYANRGHRQPGRTPLPSCARGDGGGETRVSIATSLINAQTKQRKSRAMARVSRASACPL